ncbi:MAG: hypothetical protein ACR2QJ_05310 [Geminicoccaceae bacterium]
MDFMGQAQVTVLLALAIGVLAALVAGPLLLRAYAKSLKRNMRAATAGNPAPESNEAIRAASGILRLKQVTELPSEGVRPSAVEQQRRSAVTAYGLAGLAFGLVATVLLFLVQGIEFLPLRTATVIATYSSPIVVVIGLIHGFKSRQFSRSVIYFVLILAVFGFLNAIGASTPISNFAAPFALWLFYGLPSLLLLLLFSRRLRSIAPVIFIIAAMAVIGVLLATGLLANPSILAAIAGIGFSLGLGSVMILVIVGVLGMAVFGWMGFKLAGYLADKFDRQKLSDEGLIIDAVWMFQTLVVAFALQQAAVLALLAFAAYKIVARYGLERGRAVAGENAEPALLLLRVFGFDARSSILLDDLASSWSYQGPIRLIAAPDLASRTIDHGKLLLFLAGRLDRLFLRNRDDLDQRLATLKSKRDPDGRFRVEPLYCQGDVWRQTVQALMTRSHLIVMDLRGFDKDRPGCIFEIETLLDVVPVERILLLIDDSTIMPDLQGILDSKWQGLAITSPNIAGEGSELLVLETKPSRAPITNSVISYASQLAPPYLPSRAV